MKVEATTYPLSIDRIYGVSRTLKQAARLIQNGKGETFFQQKQPEVRKELDSRSLEEEQAASQLTKLVARSGRVIQVAESPSERLAPSGQIAPGGPPLLSFRYFEGRQRHRFGKLDLVMDDAGH